VLVAFTEMQLNPYQPLVTSDLDGLEGACASELYTYWLDKKAGAPMPDWSSFEFMDLYRIAHSMLVLDVVDRNDSGKLRYRFMGTTIVEYRRLRKIPDLTGKTFADGDRAYDPTAMAEAYQACVTTAQPVMMSGEYQTENSHGRHTRLILPWAIDGQVARLTCTLDRFPAE